MRGKQNLQIERPIQVQKKIGDNQALFRDNCPTCFVKNCKIQSNLWRFSKWKLYYL